MNIPNSPLNVIPNGYTRQSYYPMNAVPQPPVTPTQVPLPAMTTIGTVTSTLTLASAMAIGANMVDVRNGTMSMSGAVLNGLVKGTAASLIMSATLRSTPQAVAIVAGMLAGAGFFIDSKMKKKKEKLCRPIEDKGA